MNKFDEFKNLSTSDEIYEKIKESTKGDDFLLIRILLQCKIADSRLKRSGLKGKIVRFSKFHDTESYQDIFMFWLECDNPSIVDDIEIRIVNNQERSHWREDVLFLRG